MACSTASSLPEHLEVRSCGRHMVMYFCSCYGRKPLQRCAVQENRGGAPAPHQQLNGEMSMILSGGI